MLATAKTQRWTPEEVLRTLVEAEIAARDEANQANRLRMAGFPVTKTLEGFERAHCSIPAPTLDYLESLEWIAGAENLCLIGPAGTGKSHLLVALGHAAVAEGKRVRYLVAAELVEALYRGLADNSVGRVIDGLLRNDLVIVDEVGFAPLDATGRSRCFASWRPPTSAARSGSRAISASRSGAASCPSTPRPCRCSIACCITPSCASPRARATACARPGPALPRLAGPGEDGPRRARSGALAYGSAPSAGAAGGYPEGGDFRWPPVGTSTWPLTTPP